VHSYLYCVVCPNCSHSLSKQVTFVVPPCEIKLLYVPAWLVFLIRSSVGGLGGCFPSLDLGNSAVLKTDVQVCQLYIGLGSFGCMPYTYPCIIWRFSLLLEAKSSTCFP
jgi:hypothetical protein